MPGAMSPLVGAAIGALFATFVTARSSPRGSDAVLVSLFAAVVFCPGVIYFLAWAPDWSFAYLLDSARRPAVVDLSLVLLSVISVPGGFLAALRISDQAAVRLRLTAGAWAAVAAVVLAGLPRLSVVATHAQFHGDFGVRPVAGSSLGWALLWIDFTIVAGALIVARALRGSATGAGSPASRRAGALGPR